MHLREIAINASTEWSASQMNARRSSMDELSKIDFPVEEKRLQTAEGVLAPAKGILRTDNNNVLGVVGLDYKLVLHKAVVEGIEKYVPTQLDNRRLTVCRGGAIMFSYYSTPQIAEEQIREGDIVSFGLEAFNSYDGSLQVGFMLRARRIKNNANLYIPKSIANISMKHTGLLNIGEIKEAFLKRMPLFMQTARKWKEWTQITPGVEKVKEFLEKVVGERLMKEILFDYEAQSDKSVWGLYNVLSQYATHEIKVRKSNEENKRVTQFNFEKKVFTQFYFVEWE
jgi:hypothetical protein